MLRLFHMFLLLILSLSVLVNAQDKNAVNTHIVFKIPAVSLVDFAGSDKRVSYKSGVGAEQIITPSTLDKTWLNYSSISDGLSTNVISVNLSSGEIPAEIMIKLSVGEDVGAGAGNIGTPVGTIVLTPYPQDIIVGIGSCYTGRGIDKGHRLTYSWEWLPQYEINQAAIENLEIGVIYTITTAK